MALLDFVIFGPGRSGTTALAWAFNAHPEVFCAIEFLRVKGDHSKLNMPEDMLRLHLSDRPIRRRSIATLQAKLTRGAVQFFGNKMPNYYFRLEQLHRQLPNLKFFYIYRSPLEFVTSWDRRAAREDDKWPTGRLGVFGALEQIFSLRRLAELPFEVSMLSYRGVFFDDSQLMRRAVEYLGASPSAFDQQLFEQTIFLQHQDKASPRAQFYDDFFDDFRFDRIDDFFSRNTFTANLDKDFVDVVNEQFAQLPPSEKLTAFLESIDPSAREFAGKWRQQLRNLMDNPDATASEWFLRYVGA